jgi:hypothetical protein
VTQLPLPPAPTCIPGVCPHCVRWDARPGTLLDGKVRCERDGKLGDTSHRWFSTTLGAVGMCRRPNESPNEWGK